MYRKFFGFTNEVFSKSIKIDQLFQTQTFKELLKRFDYIVKHRGIMLLTGEPGTGKTTALRHLIASLKTNSYSCVYIPLSTVAVVDFYRQLNSALNGESAYTKADIFHSIQNQIFNFAINRNIIPVIIFDEAHLLKDQNFKELQIITNFKCDTIDPAIFIITGQPVLADKINSYNLNSFNQRIAIKYHLQALTKSETKNYILHHFKLCNQLQPILTEAAFTAVYSLTKGIPRLIGAIVTKALILASLKRNNNIDEEDIILASKEVI